MYFLSEACQLGRASIFLAFSLKNRRIRVACHLGISYSQENYGSIVRACSKCFGCSRHCCYQCDCYCRGFYLVKSGKSLKIVSITVAVV